jgi:glyoxylase-like metal-dependent hydrolase (beta-lactamase superfamily II)
VHADYISGAAALSRALGVPYYLHPADAVYPYDNTPGRVAIVPLADDARIAVGRSRVRAAHTPGHTEGGVTFIVDERAALTGDFLFVASIGRPDLAGKTAEWTVTLWKSVERAKREWPREMMIYPAHYGSAAERNVDLSVGMPFGRLLAENRSLGHETLDSFAAWVAGATSSFPDAYRTIKAVNVGLVDVTPIEAEELEMGRNECALGGG